MVDFTTLKLDKLSMLANDWIELAKALGFWPLDKVLPLLLISFLFYLLISGKIDKLKERLVDLEKAVLEIQTLLRAKKMHIQHAIAQYGVAHSPIVLKQEFKPFVVDSGLEKQVNNKIEELTEAIRQKKPTTGLDAQKYIENLVLSDEIEKYLDVKEFKQLLYTKGKTTDDYYGILIIYLFETIIPKLGIPDGEKK